MMAQDVEQELSIAQINLVSDGLGTGGEVVWGCLNDAAVDFLTGSIEPLLQRLEHHFTLKNFDQPLRALAPDSEVSEVFKKCVKRW